MLHTLSNDEFKATVIAYNDRGGNAKATAEALGISVSTLRYRLRQATERGIGPHFEGSPLPEGLGVAGTTTLFKDGAGVLQWVRTKRGELELRDAVAIIKDAFGEPPAKVEAIHEAFKSSLMATVYPIADLHFGMYAWKEETGDDYDTEIASRVLIAAMGELLGKSPDSDLGIILNLGDYFHSDNDENLTRKSGNKVDMDTRFARVQREGIKLLVGVVETAKQKHAKVLVKNVAGNHDPYGTLALTNALAMRYYSDPQVMVDCSADPIWVRSLGRTLIAATHGDKVKPVDLPATVAANYSQAWGATDWRYGYLGHTHRLERRKLEGFESGGMEIEVFRTLAPKDSFAAGMGYVSRRSLVSVTHHYERGEIDRKTVNVRSRS